MSGLTIDDVQNTFYVNYRSFLVSKNLVLNMDDFVAGPKDYQNHSGANLSIDIVNPHTQRRIMSVVGFFPAIGDENTFILTNLMDVKYDLFEVACIVRHLDTARLRHNYEMSLRNMNDFMFRITVDDASLTRPTIIQQTPIKKQQTQAPSQEFNHYQSKHLHQNTPRIAGGRRDKFRKLFEEAIQEEPKLHINRTIDDEGDYNYGLVPLAIDIPSFQTDDGKYNPNY
jgi:hypothetical protein